MTSEIETQTLKWVIHDYFKHCETFFGRGETVVFVSRHGKIMAKLELKTIEDGETRFDREKFVSISIKTQHCLHLSSVICHRIKYSPYGSTEELFLAERQFSGQSREWRSLAMLKQFEKIYNCNYSSKVGLQFKFIINKKFGMNRNIETDLRAHLMNPAFSDITIKTSEGDEVPAHKILLVARSDVFRAQFQHDTAEKLTNTVECPFETKVVKDLLSYIYLDEVPNIEVTAFNLLVAADYYHLDPLKELCGDVLTKQLTVNNAVELLTLADAQNMSRLKQGALMFVTDTNNAVKIVKTEGWKLISEELAKSIFEFTLS